MYRGVGFSQSIWGHDTLAPEPHWWCSNQTMFRPVGRANLGWGGFVEREAVTFNVSLWTRSRSARSPLNARARARECVFVRLDCVASSSPKEAYGKNEHRIWPWNLAWPGTLSPWCHCSRRHPIAWTRAATGEYLATADVAAVCGQSWRAPGRRSILGQINASYCGMHRTPIDTLQTAASEFAIFAVSYARNLKYNKYTDDLFNFLFKKCASLDDICKRRLTEYAKSRQPSSSSDIW